MLSIVINILLAIHVLVSLFIILLVLMQRPKSEGLGAAFGGGVVEGLAGTGATTLLQNVTRWCGIIFFALSMTLSWLYVKKAGHTKESSIHQSLLNAAAPPAAPVAPVNPADVNQVEEALKNALQNLKSEESGTATSPLKIDMATPAPVPGLTPAPATTPDAEAKPAASDLPTSSESKPAATPAPATPAPAPAPPVPATPAPR
jgi:preprotein translocase subunit SecG